MSWEALNLRQTGIVGHAKIQYFKKKKKKNLECESHFILLKEI